MSTREDQKTRELSGSEQSTTGDNTHFIQSVYQSLALLGMNPNLIELNISLDDDTDNPLLFGVQSTRVGVGLTGRDYSRFVDNGWTIVQLNVERLRVFHRVFQALEVIAVEHIESLKAGPSSTPTSPASEGSDSEQQSLYEEDENWFEEEEDGYFGGSDAEDDDPLGDDDDESDDISELLEGI